MPETVLAAVLPAPRMPLEVREFPFRTCRRAGAAAHRLFRSVRHGRAPVARTARGRAVSDHSRTCVRGHARSRRVVRSRRSTARLFAKAIASCSSTCIARADAAARARSAVRRRDASRAASTASPIPRTRACSAAGPKPSTSSPASSSHGCRTRVAFEDYIGGGCGLITAVHIIERAALAAGRSRARAGDRRRRAQRDRAGAARRRVDGSRDRRSGRSARARATHGRRRGHRPAIDDRRGAAGAGPRDRPTATAPTWWSRPPDRRGPSRRAWGSCATAARMSSPATTRTPAERDQRASAHQSQASRRSGMLGQRAGTLPARAPHPRAACGDVPWREIGGANLRTCTSSTTPSPTPRR